MQMYSKDHARLGSKLCKDAWLLTYTTRAYNVHDAVQSLETGKTVDSFSSYSA